MKQNDKDNFELRMSNEIGDTKIVTSYDSNKRIDSLLAEAFRSYSADNRLYSAYLSDGFSLSERILPKELDNLAVNAQNFLRKILKINSIIRKAINVNDIIGKTVECIEANINTSIKLSYDFESVVGKKKNNKLENVKSTIKTFNNQIKLKTLIRNAITTTYAEGNYIMYLRHDTYPYKVDYYPLGVCEIADYDINGEPAVLFNIQELIKRLQKCYEKNKKNEPLFFENITNEIKNNYPNEVYEAYINKEKYAILDNRYTGVLRIGNLNRKYGLSPIFRGLKIALMLDVFDDSDRINSKAKAKKIIHQKLRKEVMGETGNRKGYEEMAYAHNNLMAAWQQPTVVVTTPPTVESIEYIEPKVELTNTDTINNYRSRLLSTLGIGFLMDSSSQSVSTAAISVTQLLRIVNTISEQLEEVIQKWYRQLLIDLGKPVEYCPTIQIIDSEELDFKLRKELATTLYTIFNGSLETALNILGFDINDEAAKRIKENDDKLDSEVFYPRATSYTSSGKETIYDEKTVGRPSSDEETDKTVYDEEYNKTRQ